MLPLPSLDPPRPLYRIGRAPDPWAWPRWDYQHTDGTFGNRWDDPGARFRVIYAASQRLGSFLEVLARFRPDPAVIAGLSDIEGEDDALAPGRVPRSFLAARVMGEAVVTGHFADIDAVDALAHLREKLAGRLVHHEIDDLDASAIKGAQRAFTQEVAEYVYELTNPAGEACYSGIAYASRLGDDQQNWAIFETPSPEAEARLIERGDTRPILDSDPDLRRAMELFHLELA